MSPTREQLQDLQANLAKRKVGYLIDPEVLLALISEVLRLREVAKEAAHVCEINYEMFPALETALHVWKEQL